MTHDEPVPHIEPGFFQPKHLEIDALLDGEPVDKEALRAALAKATTRDYLVDALLLRQLAREAGPSRFVAPATPRGPFAHGARLMSQEIAISS